MFHDGGGGGDVSSGSLVVLHSSDGFAKIHKETCRSTAPPRTREGTLLEKEERETQSPAAVRLGHHNTHRECRWRCCQEELLPLRPTMEMAVLWGYLDYQYDYYDAASFAAAAAVEQAADLPSSFHGGGSSPASWWEQLQL